MRGLFSRWFGSAAIREPVLGTLDLSNGVHRGLLDEDLEWMTSLFERRLHSDQAPPRCDVLFLYFQLTESGEVVDARGTLADLVRDSGARVAVVASPNPAEAFLAATRGGAPPGVNLVLVLDRRGSAFPTFYRRLFRAMWQGTSMPVAWAELAPQNPNADHPDSPDAIFFAGAGQVRFG